MCQSRRYARQPGRDRRSRSSQKNWQVRDLAWSLRTSAHADERAFDSVFRVAWTDRNLHNAVPCICHLHTGAGMHGHLLCAMVNCLT